MNKTKDQISWVSSHDLYWENKMYKRKRSISPRYKRRVEFYLLTQSENRRQNERVNIRCKKFFSKNEIDSSRGWKLWDTI